MALLQGEMKMGVMKVNHHKRTRFNARNGFREAQCPACSGWVYVMSLGDDTRWRYGVHRLTPGTGPRCEGSGELLVADKTL
jgi:hypothetical protein